MQSKSVFDLTLDIDIDDMYQRVRSKAFDATNIIWEVVNVELGEVEKENIDQRKIGVCKELCENKELARDIIGSTVKTRLQADSLDCLQVITPLIKD